MKKNFKKGPTLADARKVVSLLPLQEESENRSLHAYVVATELDPEKQVCTLKTAKIYFKPDDALEAGIGFHILRVVIPIPQDVGTTASIS